MTLGLLGTAEAPEDFPVRERRREKSAGKTRDYISSHVLTCPREEEADTEEHVGDLTSGERVDQVL